MKKMRKSLLLAPAAASLLSLLPLFAGAQDSPSLADAARQARQEKQQTEVEAQDSAKKDAARKEPAKDPASKTAATPPPVRRAGKVITNEDLPEHSGPATRPPIAAAYREGNGNQRPAANSEAAGERLKSNIAQQKNYVASLQGQIEKLNDSIHFAYGNCVTNCAQWNERQLKNQQQVEQMKLQLEDQKKRLEDMQESARRQGFGSSVYDP
jgi:hypothetical protein